MITKFKLFEKIVDSELENGEYYYIPFFERNLIKILLEKEKDTLKLEDERLKIVLDQLNSSEYNDLIGLYIIVGKYGFSGYWGNSKDDIENIERVQFFNDNNMIDKGILTLEPYEIEANKYNL